VISLEMEVCGWLGGIVLICAYALVSFGRIQASGILFQFLNLAGSLMLAINSAWHHAWPSAVVNLVWLAVGVGALMRKYGRLALSVRRSGSVP
jgi:hypothetical protein